MNDPETKFQPFKSKMEAAGLKDINISNFRRYYDDLLAGETGMISRTEIKPVTDVTRYEDLVGYEDAGMDALDRTVVIKLNGGLGTSMGMARAKSLLPVKDDLSFLEIILHQILHLRRHQSARLPLVLMNSIDTRADSLDVLNRYPGMKQDISTDFVQSRVPKIRQTDLSPVCYPDNPDLEWCPPGHGDIYISMVNSGILSKLLDKGYQYAFVSNADNLGAVIDPRILGHFARKNLPFMMEVAVRTPADRKGGHLAQKRSGGLTLREVAQCPGDEISEFQNIDLYRYFNTNTIWLNLEVLGEFLKAHNNIITLPLIRNAKTVNPKDPNSEPVYQLETAMGAALALFPGAEALQVPRSRFLPVKTCQDLLGLWSDAYRLTDDYHVVQSRPENDPVICRLDPDHYRIIDQLMEKFPAGAPSLIDCRECTIVGNIIFGEDIVLTGNVTVRNTGNKIRHLPDNTRLDNHTLDIT